MSQALRVAGRTIPIALRWHIAVLAVAVAAGAVLRLLGLGRHSFWTDELYVVWEGRQPLSRIFDPQLHVQHPPGYRLALHAWMGLGLDESWIRLLPALSGVLLVPVAWALARTLWPQRQVAALLAALFVATSPYLLHYSQDATTYSWSTLWLATSFLLLLRAWSEDRAYLWAAWAVSIAIAMYSHYFNFFPLLVQGAGLLFMGVSARTGARKRLLHGLFAVVGAVALYAPWLWILLNDNHGALSIYFFPLSVDTQIFHWLPTLLAGYPHQGFWQSNVALGAVWIALLLALGWATRQLRGRGKGGGVRPLALVAAWGVAATVGPYLFLRVTTPPTDTDPVRFATMCAPALLLAVAWAVASLPPAARNVLVAGWIALAGVQWWAEYTGPATQDWRGMLRTVAANASSGDAFIAFPAFHAGAAAAYYPVPLPVEGGWFTPDGPDPTGAAYWFPPTWRWQGFLDTTAHRSNDWAAELSARIQDAQRLWYLAGDGADGTYPPGPRAERELTSLGWQPVREWHASPLVLRLYTKTGR